MRILILTQVVVYPADAGPKVKTLQVLRYLARQHTVSYCTYVRNAGEELSAEKLREVCSRVSTVSIKRSRLSDVRYLLESLLTGDSFILRRDDRKAMREKVQTLLRTEHIDVLHVDQLNMMRFVPSDWSGAIILDEHNAVWQVVKRLRKGASNPISRLLLSREVRAIRKLEGDACRRASVVLTVSEQDRRALREVAGEAVPIEVVPITVDTQHFQRIYSARGPQPGHLFTIGTLFWPPNSEGVTWWLREGYSHLADLYPNLTYDIVGARPPKSLQQMAERFPGVRLHGYVADVEQFWIRATALAVPLLSGGGVRVKILEAMAMGVPVISTTIGCEGLAVRNREHLLIADTPREFAEACAAVLRDEGLARKIALNARRLIAQQYDANVALKSLDSAYERANRQSSFPSLSRT
jgi:glycosyltransferase involved in cell wall biosynthesis